MTARERGEPGVIDGSRRARIARGSGTTTQEVNQLLRQFKEAQQLMRSPGMLGGMLGGGGRGKLAQALSERMGEAADPSLAGLEALDPGALGGGGLGAGGLDRALGGVRSSAGVGAPGARAGARGRPGSKKKKGGRVTPKGDGGRSGR